MEELLTLDRLIDNCNKASHNLISYFSEAIQIAHHKPEIEVDLSIPVKPDYTPATVFHKEIIERLKKEIKGNFETKSLSFLMTNQEKMSKIFSIYFDSLNADILLKEYHGFYQFSGNIFMGPIFLKSNSENTTIKDYNIFCLEKDPHFHEKFGTVADLYYDLLQEEVLAVIKIERNHEIEEYNFIIEPHR